MVTFLGCVGKHARGKSGLASPTGRSALAVSMSYESRPLRSDLELGQRGRADLLYFCQTNRCNGGPNAVGFGMSKSQRSIRLDQGCWSLHPPQAPCHSQTQPTSWKQL